MSCRTNPDRWLPSLSGYLLAVLVLVGPRPGFGAVNGSQANGSLPSIQPVGFGLTVTAAGPGAYSVASGDFNGDGIVDLVTANDAQGADDLSVLLGNGNGTFQPPVDYPVSNYVNAVVLADFNGDGIPDLAANLGFGSFAVLLGKGDGTFSAAQYFDCGIGTEDLVAGDFNGDSRVDLALILQTGQVAVVLGNGDGTFQSPVDYNATPGFSLWLTTADFSGDGHLDLAVTSAYGGVYVLLGNGDGTFQNSVEYPSAGQAWQPVAADLNGDGKIDLAVAGDVGSKGELSVLFGNGDGTFQPYVSYALPALTQTLIAADLNSDGSLDLATAGATNKNTILTLLNNGDGTFQAPGEFSAGNQSAPFGLASGDFNGDGKIDLAAAASGTNSVAVLHQVTSVLSRTYLNFGLLKSGKVVSAKVSLSNTGQAAFTVSKVKLQGRFDYGFSQTNNCQGHTIQPGANCTITVTFTASAGVHQGEVVVDDTAVSPDEAIFLEGQGRQ